VQAIAAELGVGRTTIYRWFGSRDELIGEVLVRATVRLLEDAREGARGSGGAALLDTLDRFNRSIASAPALRRFVERERDAALRVITSGAGNVQPRIVAMVTELITAEVSAGAYEPVVEPATLGYAIVRLGEAFLFNDALARMRGDVDRLKDVEAAILGVSGVSRTEAS
jgi:AcrR family transcriptional regulator